MHITSENEIILKKPNFFKKSKENTKYYIRPGYIFSASSRHFTAFTSSFFSST